MTQVSSTAHMFHFRWFVQLARTPSSSKIGFKTRYGMVANPFAEGLTQGYGRLQTNANRYYRRVLVKNLM